MKSKWLTYVLLLVVILIWGIIIKRLIAGSDPQVQKQSIELSKTDTFIKTRSYRLQLNYTEAFLHTNYKLPSTSIKKKSKVFVEKIDLPNVKYKGIIKNNKEPQNTIVILEMDNVDYFFKVKQEYLGIKLIKYTENSIWISKKGKKFEILKSDE
jgi:hypothetical protein